ncbi:MAG: hypothetical protein ACPG5Z_11360 [Pseudoalteromonas sp.]|uniref:hypothetical protein n=1 Tax=unclassified Pseudoalteromonas TaxID=194690 RepID=UPI000C075EC7|nr:MULTISPECIES: hypothetical protein [unclassified Pseudoalteromonas]MDP2636683.1 hypothetical protein [Pseudoalteromonas sp. 1_MG-2023]PHN88281.1 hypothetical protein CSC79_18705 [Pseudoalteromonas sp. 3D05]
MRFSLCVVVLSLFIVGCSDAATPEAEQLKPAPTTLTKNSQAVAIGDKNKAVSREAIQAAHKQLKTLTEDLSCDTSTQCKVLPVGSRACGGPSSYLVFSTKNNDSQKVEQAAKQITTLESQFNAQTGMVSICQHLTAPATQCTSNKCVKVAGNATSVY